MALPPTIFTCFSYLINHTRLSFPTQLYHQHNTTLARSNYAPVSTTTMTSELNADERRDGPSNAAKEICEESNDDRAKATIEKLKVHLQQLMEKDMGGRRVISPATEKIVKGLLQRLDPQRVELDSLDSTSWIELAQEIRGRLPEIHERIRRDEAFEPALTKLEELRTLQFPLRYSVYLEPYMSFLRQKHAQSEPPPDLSEGDSESLFRS